MREAAVFGQQTYHIELLEFMKIVASAVVHNYRLLTCQ